MTRFVLSVALAFLATAQECKDLACGENQWCRKICDDTFSDAVNYECVYFQRPGESCGGYSPECKEERCHSSSPCLYLPSEPGLVDEAGKCSSCDQEEATRCLAANGEFDVVSCDCAIETPCPELLCPAIFCENGYELDENGCETCWCATTSCPDVLCDMFCEFGFAVDDEGCKVCKCREKPEIWCPELICPAIFCEHGYELDENGCETCQCATTSCPDVLCEMFCEFGFAVDDEGCEVCKCREKPEIWCPDFICIEKIFCENGYELDENGCQTCQCAAPCPDVLCEMFCEHGFEVDDGGCRICKCREPRVCEDVFQELCDMYFNIGYQYPGYEWLRAECPRPDCGPKPECEEICEYYTDDDGCYHCDCPVILDGYWSPCLAKEFECEETCEWGYDLDEDCSSCRCYGPPDVACPAEIDERCSAACPYGHELGRRDTGDCYCLCYPSEDTNTGRPLENLDSDRPAVCEWSSSAIGSSVEMISAGGSFEGRPVDEMFVNMDNLPCASGPDVTDPILVACDDCMYPVSAQGQGYSVNLPPWPVQVHEAGPRFNWIPRYSCRVGGCTGDLPWHDLNSGGACYNEALTYGNPCYCDAACTRFKDCCYDFIWSCKISAGIQDFNMYTGEELYGIKELGDMLL